MKTYQKLPVNPLLGIPCQEFSIPTVTWMELSDFSWMSGRNYSIGGIIAGEVWLRKKSPEYSTRG